MFPLTRLQHIFLQLVAIPLAALVASHVVFSQVFPGQAGYQFPWPYFLTVVTVMFSCWEVNMLIFRWLDTRLPFRQNPVRRLSAQVLLGGVCTLLTFAIVFPLAQRVYMNSWPPVHTLLKGLTVCITLATIVNGGYSGLYLLRAFFAERQKRADHLTDDFLLAAASRSTLPLSTSLVAVELSTGQVWLPVDQIAYFYSTGGLVLLVKADG
ncbi:LytTR family transcriptional regulator, partial [Spirosoma migulaei]